MNAVANIVQFPIADIDRLGALKAAIADLTAEADAIVEALRARGKGAYEGSQYKAVVSDEALVQTLDAAAAKAKLAELGVPAEWVAEHTKVSVRKAAVRVVAR
jgi:D-serine deaminase-like pyridoxal phosphate-dependent protein